MLLKKRKNLDTLLRAVACATVLSIAVSLSSFDARCDEISHSVFRLHILANSNSDEDQELKLKVRNAVILKSEELFKDCDSKEEAMLVAGENIDLFKETAEAVIMQNGYSYTVDAMVGKTWFETRDYENFSLPAGTYDAVRLIIGEGRGKNWWCVMFPGVCLPSVTKSQGNKEISDNMSKAEADIVLKPKRYKARFKIVEIFQKAGNFFGKIL